jgi:hypothetical protein
MATNQLTEYLSAMKCQGFKPRPYYSKDGDFVTYYFSDQECYAERMDDLLTVYLSLDDKGLVGVKLKGVTRLRDELADFQVFDGTGKLMLGMLFFAGGFLYAGPNVIDQYRRIARATKSVPLEESDLEPAGCD